MGVLGSMFGGGESSVDNSGAFRDFSDKMQQRAGVYDPWINAGAQGRDKAMGEYDKLTNNPNFLQDMIAKGFYESPYQKYMQDMTTKRMNYNASNTGMLGSGAANRALQGELTNMTGGFLNDYINRGMGSYEKGLAGYGGMADMGYKALGDQTNVLEQAYGGALQGDLSKNAYDASQEANSNNMWGNLIGAGIGLATNGPGGGFLGRMINGNKPNNTVDSNGYGYISGASGMPGVKDFNVGNLSY